MFDSVGKYKQLCFIALSQGSETVISVTLSQIKLLWLLFCM